MIDHFTLTVRDLARSKAFYTRVLATLGYRPVMEFGDSVGFGDTKPYLWMKAGDPPTQPMHIAFEAKRRADVNAFYAAAREAGAPDNGPPGVRAHYHPSYYGAFVMDPDGHPIEAVCHQEPARERPRKPAAKARPAARKTARASAKRRPAARAKRR